MMTPIPALLATAVVALSVPLWAQSAVRDEFPNGQRRGVRFEHFTRAQWEASNYATAAAMQTWQDRRYGMFIHFGVTAKAKHELSWGSIAQRYAPDTPSIMANGKVRTEAWTNWPAEMRLERFNAVEWVEIARRAGFKYIVVCAKHHEGFHMWDTAFSDFKITRTPFGRDYIKELVDACHQANMPVGFYFAQREWYHPDYQPVDLAKVTIRDVNWTLKPGETSPLGPRHAKYLEYMRNAIRELCTKYGKIDIWWWDALTWDGMFTKEMWDSEHMTRLIRELQPDIVINNRASLPGDFDTPEGHLGGYQDWRPWESCIPLADDWCYTGKPAHPFDQVLQLIVGAACGNGNLLLSWGPHWDGQFDDGQKQRLFEIGDWLRENGASIYGTRGGPWKPAAWGGSTRHGNTTYIHLFQRPISNIVLPAIPGRRVLAARLLAGGEAVAFRQTDSRIELTVPGRSAIQGDLVIEITMNGPLDGLPAMDVDAMGNQFVANRADNETSAEKSVRMQWFNEARFGMFIHLGVYSTAAGSWNGRPIPGDCTWIQSTGRISSEEYRNTLLGQFNPVNYDPEAWVLAAKAAGMKYLVVTAKHHDGFCLWDSKFTTWDVGSTPYQKDLLKPLAAACRKHGLKFCLYYSLMDWSNPDYGTKAAWRGNARKANPDMAVYVNYVKDQLNELLANYGDVGLLWFDGEWEGAWTHDHGVDLHRYLRDLQPSLIINNRIDKGRVGLAGNTSDPKYKGDFGTPEQEIPTNGFGAGAVWESCMTINDTWGFKTNDKNWKSAQTLVRNLIDSASKGGNYLLNVGPTGDGEIPATSLERLTAIGSWMKTNGESIHGTGAALLPMVSWDGRCTTGRTANGMTRIYLHLFSRPEHGRLAVRGLWNRPEQITILGRPGELAVAGKPGAWQIQLPEFAMDPFATVVSLAFRGEPSLQLPVIEPDAAGSLKLEAQDATLHGGNLTSAADYIGGWSDVADFASWDVRIPAGSYQATLTGACGTGGSELKLRIGASEEPFSFPATGSWENFRDVDAGTLSVRSGGPAVVSIHAASGTGVGFVNIRAITLTKQP